FVLQPCTRHGHTLGPCISAPLVHQEQVQGEVLLVPGWKVLRTYVTFQDKYQG
uniref:Uncharacterized protein n=1 Tax=Oryza brachyantha TaxID=4533 RepID=J3LS64_ORYBR